MTILSTAFVPTGTLIAQELSDTNLITLSQQLLLAAKKKDPADSIMQTLNHIPESLLETQLTNDAAKKAFWLNIYNAYTQLMLANNPEQYKKRSRFFGAKKIAVAGKQLSLDMIEHGILRKSSIKWSLGYLRKLFPGSFERKHRVDTVDYRIHFALNCGAKSCPPIAFYRPEQLNKQLDLATKVYLRGESEYNPTVNKVYVPALMSWFRHDFGGKKQMKELLRQTGVINTDQDPDIRFKKYNWELYLANYQND